MFNKLFPKTGVKTDTFCVCFLLKKLENHDIEFYEQLQKYYSVFLVIDNNIEKINLHNNIQIIQINDDECRKQGFKDSSTATIAKDVISWDKALYFFCRLYQNFDYVWLIEDDVFIPNIECLKKIDINYPYADLITSEHDVKNNKQLTGWPHWSHAIKNNISLPWSHSMICAVRLSKRMFQVINTFVLQHKKLFFIEIMFNTLAIHHRLKIKTPAELKTIYWRYDWKKEEFELYPNNLFHPIKNQDLHKIFR